MTIVRIRRSLVRYLAHHTPLCSIEQLARTPFRRRKTLSQSSSSSPPTSRLNRSMANEHHLPFLARKSHNLNPRPPLPGRSFPLEMRPHTLDSFTHHYPRRRTWILALRSCSRSIVPSRTHDGGNRRAEGRILCPTEVPAERRLVGRGSGNHGRCDGTTSGTGDGRRFYRVLGG